MATSLKSKRRTPGSKTKNKNPKALSKRGLPKALRRPVMLKAVLPKAPARQASDPHPQYTKAVNFLMSHTDYEKMRIVRYNTSTFSLDRMRTLLKHLGNPHTKFKSAHIAGTKGKGS